MLRDARINQIGEGANEVLASFIALANVARTGPQLSRAPSPQTIWEHGASAWKNRCCVHRRVRVLTPNSSAADHLSGLIRRFAGSRVLFITAKNRPPICAATHRGRRNGLYAGLCAEPMGCRTSSSAAAGPGLAAADLCADRSGACGAGCRNCTKTTTISSPPRRATADTSGLTPINSSSSNETSGNRVSEGVQQMSLISKAAGIVLLGSWLRACGSRTAIRGGVHPGR